MDGLYELNVQYLKELREYLEQERTLRDAHQKRIEEILAQMQRIANKERPLE